MKPLLYALALLVSLPLQAADVCSADVRALNALYDVRDAMLNRSWDVSSRIAGHIDEMRDPLPGGGYRWVMWVRPSGEGPVVKREHLISTAESAGGKETFEAAGDRPYAVRVVVPRKRSTFKANNPVWVSDLSIRYRVDGKEKTLEKRIDQWMQPDTAKSFDLGVIAESADATLNVATKPEFVQQALVEVHFRQAVPQDDPANPDFAAIQVLHSLGSTPDPVALEREIARLEVRLFPDAPLIRLYPLIDSLRSAQKLIASDKPEEQEKGKKQLKQALETAGMR